MRQGNSKCLRRWGGFQEDKPYAYQEVEGQRLEVVAAYLLTGEDSHRVQYGFRVAPTTSASRWFSIPSFSSTPDTSLHRRCERR